MKTKDLLIIIISIISLAAFETKDVVDQSLLKLLKTKSQVDVMVSLKEGVSKTIAQAQSKNIENRHQSRSQKITTLHSALVYNAEESQKEIKSLIKAKGFSYKSFWITNKILIQNANLALVEQLSMLPSIDQIREQIVSKLYDIVVTPNAATISEIQWGVSKVRAHEFWNSGYRGQGVVVGVIDSGVRGTHQILKRNFVGKNGWFDPYDLTQTPNDSDGHGTHCTGTIVGEEGYGVAPGAKWMACKGCSGERCAEAATLACGEFMLCPTDAAFENSNCSLAPNIVSNSWGGPGGRDFYDDVIKIWHYAGIIPIFAAGNEGPNCTTVGSPGDRDVIAVGATTIEDRLAYFSSKGPTISGGVKPDISAPGYNIISAGHLSDNAFVQMSGTSMATPHLAGVVALLLSQYKDLTYNQIKETLFKSAVKVNLASDFPQMCGNIAENIFPNNAFGNGLVDAVQASEQASSSSNLKCIGFILYFMLIVQTLLLKCIH